MTTLTLCTSTSQGSLALSREGEVLKDLVWLKDKSHSEKITTQIEEIFESAKVDLKDLELLICSKGPGSFTGIRVGLSVIKTLAYAYKLPVIAVNDCWALALNALGKTSLPIAVMLDAQKNKVFLATYAVENNQLREITAPALVGLDELESCLPEKQYLCLGDGFAHFENFLSKTTLKKLQRDSKISDLPLAKTIFNSVFKAVSIRETAFEKINWQQLEPLYLRSSAAEEVLAAKKLGN